MLGRFGFNSFCAFACAGPFGLGLGDLGAGVFVLVAQNGQGAVPAGAGFGQRADVGVRLLNVEHELLRFGAQGFGAGVELVKLF